ncbi:MAG: hypothetical protein RSD47_09015 [Romboutsia sp.]
MEKNYLNLDANVVVSRIKNGEFLSDIAAEMNTSPHVVFIKINRHEEAFQKLCEFIGDYKSKSKTEKNIVKEILKEEEKAKLIHRIISNVNAGQKLSELAKEDFVSTSSYSRLLKEGGYEYNTFLNAYTHSIFDDVGGYARAMKSIDYEEEVDILFNALYYEYIEEKKERASYMSYNFETTGISIYHKLYDELEEIGLGDGFECMEDFIHYLLLRYVYKRTKRNNTYENEVQEMKDVEGFTTDDEIEVLKKNNFLYEDDEVEKELIQIYKPYLLNNGYESENLDKLDCWDLFELFHKKVDKK